MYVMTLKSKKSALLLLLAAYRAAGAPCFKMAPVFVTAGWRSDMNILYVTVWLSESEFRLNVIQSGNIQPQSMQIKRFWTQQLLFFSSVFILPRRSKTSSRRLSTDRCSDLCFCCRFAFPAWSQRLPLFVKSMKQTLSPFQPYFMQAEMWWLCNVVNVLLVSVSKSVPLYQALVTQLTLNWHPLWAQQSVGFQWFQWFSFLRLRVSFTQVAFWDKQITVSYCVILEKFQKKPQYPQASSAWSEHLIVASKYKTLSKPPIN